MSTALQTRMKAPTESSFTAVNAGLLQRKCACGGSPGVAGECAGCGDEKLKVQRRAAAQVETPHGQTRGDGGAGDPWRISARLGAGQPLDERQRSRMESAFGHDFSRVRIHHDARATDLSASLDARAFTIGRHVAFAAGEYRPGTRGGDAILAHELAHVVQQGEAGDAPLDGAGGATSYDSLEEDADGAAARAVASLWGGDERRAAGPAPTVTPRLKSGLSVQRQRCSKADNRVVTDPLRAEVPPVRCEPTPEPLATVRAKAGVANEVLGVTRTDIGTLGISYQETRGGRCVATIDSLYALSFDPFIYAEAGTHDDGVEVVPRGRPCAGRTITRRLRIMPDLARKLKAGEIEHCEDHKLAFALSNAKFNQAVRDLAGEYCAESPDCQGEFANRFKARTGVEFNDQATIMRCLHEKSKLRDNPPNNWHSVISDDWFYSPDCSAVTYIPTPALMTHIGRHSSASIIKDCGEPQAGAGGPARPAGGGQ